MVAALLLASSAKAAAEGVSPLDELVQRQSGLKSVHSTFTQEQHDPMMGGAPITSAGDFYFRTGKGVRWEYKDALVIYDGSALYVYSPELKEAQKIKGQRGFMGPLAFDVKELLSDYEVKASSEGGAIVLALKPKAEMPFSSMRMKFPESQAFPSEVTVVQETGEKAVIRFENIELNAAFSDELFKFYPPPGTEIVERQFE